MDNYTMTGTFTLPSKGLIYGKPVKEQVTLRSMTTADEMRRLSPSDAPNGVMARIIDDCMVDDIGISCYDMHIGDFQFLLHRLRVVTYGPEYKMSSKCRWCASENINTINLDDLKVIEYTPDFDKLFDIDLPVTKKHIKLRMQTPRLIDGVSLKVKDSKNLSNTESAFFYTVQSLIDQVDGEKLDVVQMERFVKTLPMMDTNYIIQKGQKINEAIGVDTNFIVGCDICGLEYRDSFRITSEFFGPTVD